MSEKKMAPKKEFEKTAWNWIETTTPEKVTWKHVEKAYRLHLQPCKSGSCRKNCAGNPHCFEALRSLEWLKDSNDDVWLDHLDVEDPNVERRPQNSFVGLKNLGATCYVNSLLQLWFHNTIFRNAIYKWSPELGEEDNDKLWIEDSADASISEEWQPKSVIGQLQYIFALLQFSNRRYIDPTSFIKSLGLNTDEQQDAQEFSKLFISLLEEKLKSQKNAAVCNMIQEQFRGECAYVTCCSRCQKSSMCLSNFYELDLLIKDSKDLHSCIQNFLQEEKLDGTNQYFCDNCKSKENATRKIQLIKLPPVLNMQLLRFVFDRQTARKKKLKNPIKFPEVLDMSGYMHMTSTEGTMIYDLNAVLIHHGRSAYSGHYVAHIRDRQSASWFTFNDEDIRQVAGKKLKLAMEDDLEDDTKAVRAASTSKSYHSSKNAYMLVYHRRDMKINDAPGDLSVEWDVPEKIQDLVMKDNSKFEEWVSELDEMRAQNVKSGKEKQLEVKNLYEMLPCLNVSGSWEWLPTEWIIEWLSGNSLVQPIEHLSACCPHNKLDPDCVTQLKCVNQKAVDMLYRKYGGGPRMGKDMLCKECVVLKCEYLQLRTKIQQDGKLISEACRNGFDENEIAFWVGKTSFAYWRKLALKHFEDDQGNFVYNKTNAVSTVVMKSTENAEDHKGAAGDDISDSCITSSDNSLNFFNDDIICLHGKLSTNDACRRMIPASAWMILKFYFPTAMEFRNTVEPCFQCREQTAEAKQLRDVYRTLAAEQKSYLPDLYADHNRPQLDVPIDSPLKLYAVSSDFVQSWRKFVKGYNSPDPVKEIFNQVLLCSHNLLLYQPECTRHFNSPKDKIVLLWEEEWKKVCSMFRVDQIISLILQPPGMAENQSNIVYSPELCSACIQNRLLEERRQLFDYHRVQIFICKVSSEESTVSSSSQDISGGQQAEQDDDQDYVQVSNTAKRKKLNNSMRSPVTSLTDNRIETPVRRSSRNRRCRGGGHAIIVSSSDTLQDLKVEIMKKFAVAPFDQHLTLNGKHLVGHDVTLGELGILPGCVIQLRVDEPSGETVNEQDSTPEEGFKGTELLRS